MSGPAGAYLFLLGFACGPALLAVSAYGTVSPRWVRWLLVAAGGLVIARYVVMAAFALAETPDRLWAWHRLWFGSMVGLTVPGVFAIDALIRHPAMTPKKLLLRFSPFLAAYLVLAMFAEARPAADRLMGWSVALTPGWRLAAGVVQSAFVMGAVGLCVLLIRKIPVRPIQLALGLLALAYACLAADGLILAGGGWYARPFLYSEMCTSLSLWHAFRTAAAVHGGP
jgi:hypothetical protein